MSEMIFWIATLLPVVLAVAVALLMLTDVRAGEIIEALRRLPSSQDDGSDHSGEAGGGKRRERSAA